MLPSLSKDNKDGMKSFPYKKHKKEKSSHSFSILYSNFIFDFNLQNSMSKYSLKTDIYKNSLKFKKLFFLYFRNYTLFYSMCLFLIEQYLLHEIIKIIK